MRADHVVDVFDRTRTVRQRREKDPSVRLVENSRIEDGHGALIAVTADQTSKPLFQFDGGFGNLVVHERVSAGGPNGLLPGFDQWAVGNRKGELGDDDGLQRVTGHVDALPEAFGAEQNGVRIGREAFDHARSGQAVGLGKEGDALGGEPRRQLGSDAAEQIVAGEEYQRPSRGGCDVPANQFRNEPFVAGWVGGRFGHSIDEDELRLGRVVEGAAEFFLVRLGETQTGLEEIKRRISADGERGAGEDDAGDAFEEMFAERRADVERGLGKTHAPSAARAEFDPVDGVLRFLGTPGFQIGGMPLESVVGGLEILALGIVVDSVAGGANVAGKLAERVAGAIYEGGGVVNAAVFSSVLHLPFGHVVEKIVGHGAAAGDRLLFVGEPVVNQQATTSVVIGKLVKRVRDLSTSDRSAEVGAGDRFDRMGFVKDDGVVIGEQANAGASQRKIAEEKRVIDD